jgi:hypothetical protein
MVGASGAWLLCVPLRGAGRPAWRTRSRREYHRPLEHTLRRCDSPTTPHRGISRPTGSNLLGRYAFSVPEAVQRGELRPLRSRLILQRRSPKYQNSIMAFDSPHLAQVYGRSYTDESEMIQIVNSVLPEGDIRNALHLVRRREGHTIHLPAHRVGSGNARVRASRLRQHLVKISITATSARLAQFPECFYHAHTHFSSRKQALVFLFESTKGSAKDVWRGFTGR